VEPTVQAVLCGLRKGSCLGYHRAPTLRADFRRKQRLLRISVHMGLVCIEHGPRLGAAPNLKERRNMVRATMLGVTHLSTDDMANMLLLPGESNGAC
jgi:hypothetical protein